MQQYLLELYQHQAWADAEIWRAVFTHKPSASDEAILKRLNHINQTQRAFLILSRGEILDRKNFRDVADPSSLRQTVREYHEQAIEFVTSISDAQLHVVLTIPWFRNPPLEITVGQALTQAAMHSHYHRGQNAMRIRELGSEPPLTDYIAWIWKKKPEPNWDFSARIH